MSVNFVLALAKLSAGLWGHSFALMADGLESLSDVLSGIAVYYGLKISLLPPDKDHPYGHGKAEPIATVIVGLFLAAPAVGISAESIHEIRTPHPLPTPSARNSDTKTARPNGDQRPTDRRYFSNRRALALFVGST